MVRIIVDRQFTDSLRYIEAAGLSTDSKPIGTIVTGSLFLEADTGKVFVYDETGAGTWNEIGGAGA